MNRTPTVVDAVIVAVLKQTGILPENGQATEALERGEDVSFAALEMDSLDRFEAIMHIEETFDIELDDDEVTSCETIFAFCDFLADRLPADMRAPD